MTMKEREDSVRKIVTKLIVAISKTFDGYYALQEENEKLKKEIKKLKKELKTYDC